jgi:hypothetical protein
MTLSRMLSTLVALALVGADFSHGLVSHGAEQASAVPADKYLLRYKFAMGEVLRYQVKQASNLRSTVDGTTQSLKTQSDSVKVWKVTDVLPSGEIEFLHLVESVKMTNETPGQPARTFDSSSKEKPAPGFESAARAVGVPLVKVRIAADGKVVSREEQLPQQAAPAEDMPITLELPDEAIAVGDKWNHVYNIPVKKQSGAEVRIRTRRLCQLRQVQSGVAVIDVEYQILTPVDPYVRAQIVERLTKGSVRFDVERGRVVQQQHEVDRREVGFAAQQNASSMHFVARTQERLLEGKSETAAVQPASAEIGVIR